jgi:protein-disulfide isomerase
MSVTPLPSSAPGAPDYSQPQAYGSGDGYQGGYPAGYPGAYPGGYGYAPMPAPRSSVPLVIGLAVIGFVILIGASALVLLMAAPRNADEPGFANGVPAIQASGMDRVSSGAIVVPTVTTTATIPSSGRTLGNPNSPVTVDIYVDYQCPVCRDFEQTVMPQIISSYVATGKAKIVSHDFLVIDLGHGGHESADAANAALCAADQGKFWSFQDWLFANQGAEASGAFAIERLMEIGSRAGLAMNKFQPCVTGGTHLAEVQAESASVYSRLSGTPTVEVNGQTLAGFDYASVSAAIDSAFGTSR